MRGEGRPAAVVPTREVEDEAALLVFQEALEDGFARISYQDRDQQDRQDPEAVRGNECEQGTQNEHLVGQRVEERP